MKHFKFDRQHLVEINLTSLKYINMNKFLLIFILNLKFGYLTSVTDCIFYKDAMCPLQNDNIVDFENEVSNPLTCQQM